MTDMPRREALVRKTMAASSAAHYAVMYANFGLKGQGYADPGYVDRLDIIDAAILKLSAAKWRYWRSTGEAADFAVRTGSDDDLKTAVDLFGEAEGLSNQAQEADLSVLAVHADAARELKKGAQTNGSETLFYDETPLVPSSCPIVVLQGNSVDMGRQYVTQVLEVYGAFAFEGLSNRSFSDAALAELRKWEAELKTHAPEICDMAVGMAEGARQANMPLSYDQALSMFTGTAAPVKSPQMIGVENAEICSLTGYFGTVGDDTAETSTIKDAPDLCSGFAAWGSATQNDGGVIGCTTDHDCSFQATIVAYPDTGNAFIYTPFSVNGSVPGVGRFFLAGHPGVNEKGLSYVHHGGPCGCMEPQSSWGYGIRRGPSTLHALRFCDTLEEAERHELALPIGDDGRLLGAPGGFYAAHNGGIVIESRTGGDNSDTPMIRRQSKDSDGNSYDYLYANNNVLSEAADGMFCAPDGGYDFSAEIGWHTLEKSKIFSGDLGHVTRHMWSASSEPRNRYISTELKTHNGGITTAVVENIYRRGPDLDTANWKETEARIHAGEKLPGSIGTRLNAQVTVIETALDKPITYDLSIGPIAHRSVSPHRPAHGFYYFDETNEMWSIELTPSPEDMLQRAIQHANSCLDAAHSALESHTITGAGRTRLRAFLQTSEAMLAQARATATDAESKSGDASAAAHAKGLRQATQAQVRAKQVLTACANTGAAS